MPLTQVQGGMILPSTTLTTPIVATTMGVGGATPAASGSGITFPATKSPSSDANTLDDYEEGTFTPNISFGAGTTGITYSFQTGWYTKIGNIVSVQIFIELTSKGSSTSGITFINNLPFTTPATLMFSGSAFGYATGFVAGFPTTAYLEPNNTRLVLFNSNSGGFIGDGNFTNTSVFTLQCTYRVA